MAWGVVIRCLLIPFSLDEQSFDCNISGPNSHKKLNLAHLSPFEQDY